MHELEEQVADRCRSAQDGCDEILSLTAEAHTGALQRLADTFSVRLLAADEYDQDAAVLSVHGEIDLGTAPMLREALLPALEHQTGPVVVDLCEVPFMDSTGVHLLVDTLQQLRLEHRRLAIACREGGPVHRVLGLVGLLDTVAVYRSRESALIGGDDRLRPEPGWNRSWSAAQALTHRSSAPRASGVA
jgi:anti-sigma B factor antagonist